MVKRDNTISDICVYYRENESYESLLRRFKKKVSKSGILQELKTREFYEKPSVRKRRRQRESIQRTARENSKKLKMMKKFGIDDNDDDVYKRRYL